MNQIKRLLAFFFITTVLISSAVACGSPTAGSETAKRAKDAGSKRQASIYPAQVSYLGEQDWGYIDQNGRFVLQPVFTQAYRFQSNGLAVAGEGNRVGLINRNGRFVVQPVYSSIGDFSDHLAIAQDDAGFEVLNSRGEVISEKYPFIGTYSSNRAPYYIQEQDGVIRYGYLDENGKTVIAPVYQYAGDFEGDRAVVRLSDRRYALIDKKGTIVKNLNYSIVMNPSDGMIAFSPDLGGRYGYLNANGEVAIAPKFLTAYAFKNGTAVVNASGDYTVNRYGLIDKKGKYLINPQYNDILQLGDGRVALGVAIDPRNLFAGSRYALAEEDGTILTDFIFYGIGPFHNGVASVHNNTETYFIDETGKRVEQYALQNGIGTLELLDGLVFADIDMRPYYTDRQGMLVYRPEQSVVLKNGITIREVKFRPNRNYIVYYPELSGMENLKVEDNVNMRLRDLWTNKTIKPTDSLDYQYEGSFSIGLNQKNLLVLKESAYDFPFGAAHGMPIMNYVHVNTHTGVFYQLEDLFKDGSRYTEVLSGIVKEQIREHGDEMGVWPDSYKGIRADQPFFLTADALNLYFRPYEIAPYAAGFPTFTIPLEEISEIINKKGSFWLSFH